VVSSVEAYVDSILRTLIAASGYNQTAFFRAMLAELEDKIYQSWAERHSWLKKGFSVSIAGSAAAYDLLTLVDLRNALFHGNGRLTEKQSGGTAALIDLEHRLWRTLEVRTENRVVHLASSTGGRAVGVARAYIFALDTEVRLKQPGARV